MQVKVSIFFIAHLKLLLPLFSPTLWADGGRMDGKMDEAQTAIGRRVS